MHTHVDHLCTQKHQQVEDSQPLEAVGESDNGNHPLLCEGIAVTCTCANTQGLLHKSISKVMFSHED
eukprot:366337-Chlamydomonas_euryale.AAC.14